jgi:beta-phosphoglucomutase-like phosphatase (HAD superfamily)
MNILDFSVFVFDFDGVIINSEFIHYECYQQAFKQKIAHDLDWDEYCKIHHSIDNTFEKQFPENFKEIYYEKTEPTIKSSSQSTKKIRLHFLNTNKKTLRKIT